MRYHRAGARCGKGAPTLASVEGGWREIVRLPEIKLGAETSRPAKGHRTCPYLPGGLRVERPGQVWCADITHLPLCRGFLCLVAVMDWFTRKGLAWRIPNTPEAVLRYD